MVQGTYYGPTPPTALSSAHIPRITEPLHILPLRPEHLHPYTLWRHCLLNAYSFFRHPWNCSCLFLAILIYFLDVSFLNLWSASHSTIFLQAGFFFPTYILGIVLHNTHLPLYTVVVFVQYTIPSVQHCQSGHLHIHLGSEHANHRTMVQHEAKCSDCWSVLLGSHGMKLWHWIWCQKKSVLQVKRFPWWLESNWTVSVSVPLFCSLEGDHCHPS